MDAPGGAEGAGASPGAAHNVRLIQFTPGLAAVVLTILFLWIARSIAPVLLLFFVAVLLAVFLDALRDFLIRRLTLRERPAFALAIFIMLLALYGIGALLVPAVIEQTRQLVASLPQHAAEWQRRLAELVERFPALEPYIGKDRQAEVVNAGVGQAERFVGAAIPHVIDVVTGFIDVVAVMVMALYLALHPGTYEDFLVSITPPRAREASRAVLRALGETLRAWSLAQLLTMTVLGLLTAIGLWALGVPYSLTFGIFSGVAAIVPFFGTLVSTLLPALFVLGGAGGLGGAVLVLLLGVVVHLIEGNVVAPLIMQRGVHLPPVFSIMAVLIAGEVLGPVGLLVAVPILAVVMVLVRKILIERVYGDVSPVEEAEAERELAEPPA